MRKAIAAVARGLGLAHKLPSWLTPKASVSADAELASVLEELAGVERKAKAEAAAGRGSARTAATTSADPKFAELLADLSKSKEELLSSCSGARLGLLGRALATAEGGIPRDMDRATELWLAGAAKQDVYSMHQVALCLIDGVGKIPQNRAVAEDALHRLVSQGKSGFAAFALAGLLIRNVLDSAGVSYNKNFPDVALIPVDHRMDATCVRAFRLLELAASAPNVAPAWLNIAHCYFYGIGTQADATQGTMWLRKAADQGDMLAVVELAGRLAEQASSAAAQNPSAPLYTHKGAAGKPDPLLELGKASARWESTRLWRRAAEGGHPVAMHNLAVYLVEGWGPWMDAAAPSVRGGKLVTPSKGEPDHAAALIWFRRAATAGFHCSMINLADLLERGKPGVPRDLPSALDWYKQAKEAADRAAARAEGAGSMLQRDQLRHTALMLQTRAHIVQARLARAHIAEDEAEGSDADLQLNFRSVEDRDEALKALTTLNDGKPGAGTAFTAAGLLSYLNKHHVAAGGGQQDREEPRTAGQTPTNKGQLK